MNSLARYCKSPAKFQQIHQASAGEMKFPCKGSQSMIQLPLVIHPSKLFDVILISPNKGSGSYCNLLCKEGKINSLFTSGVPDT